MKLFLFTNFFPFEKAEPFLVNEFSYTSKSFNSITILPLYGKEVNSTINNKNIHILKPVFENASKKKTIFKKGLFNAAPLGHHLMELFSRGILFSPKKIYWFFISLLITRSALASSSFKELKQELNKHNSGVLYFYWGDNLTWLVPYLHKHLKGKGWRIVVRLHGSDLYEDVKAGYAPLREKIFNSAHLIVTVSENGATYLKNKYSVYSHKIISSRLGVFDNGTNPQQETDEFIVTSVSNVVALKRLHLIFESLQKCSLKITWHHFGSGPLLEKLKIQAGQARTGLNIKFHGHVNNSEVMEFYKNNHVDLFLNVSNSEGLPVSIMEAFSFGIPVMATDVGGTSELVDDTVGKLLDKDFDTTELAELIESFAKSNKAEKRKNAREAFFLKVSADKNYREFYKLITEKD